jgi:hypothetical protein
MKFNSKLVAVLFLKFPTIEQHIHCSSSVQAEPTERKEKIRVQSLKDFAMQQCGRGQP